MFYPVRFLCRSTGGYQVDVPDLPGCSITSESVEIGFEKIKEAVVSHLMILAEYGESIPHATKIDHFIATSESDTTWAILPIDITPYLGKSHKINVTLPELLIKQIDDRVNKSEQYKSRSGFIATACIAELKR
ncbi:type II toxin-antitoxin system HicB family antitoxin [Colwellia sp. MEBiC06753]